MGPDAGNARCEERNGVDHEGRAGADCTCQGAGLLLELSVYVFSTRVCNTLGSCVKAPRWAVSVNASYVVQLFMRSVVCACGVSQFLSKTAEDNMLLQTVHAVLSAPVIS